MWLFVEIMPNAAPTRIANSKCWYGITVTKSCNGIPSIYTETDWKTKESGARSMGSPITTQARKHMSTLVEEQLYTPTITLWAQTSCVVSNDTMRSTPCEQDAIILINNIHVLRLFTKRILITSPHHFLLTAPCQNVCHILARSVLQVSPILILGTNTTTILSVFLSPTSSERQGTWW